MATVNSRNNAFESALGILKVDMGCALFAEENGGFVLKLMRGAEEVDVRNRVPRTAMTAIVADWAEKHNRRILPTLMEQSNPKTAPHARRWVYVDTSTLKPKAPLTEVHFTPI